MRPAVPLRFLIEPELAAALSGDQDSTWLDDLGIVEYSIDSQALGIDFDLAVVPLSHGAVEGVQLLGLPGFAVLLAATADDALRLGLLISDRGTVLSAAVPLSLRFQPPLFHRVDPSSWEIRPDTAEGVLVGIGTPALTVSVLADADGNVQPSLDLAYEVPGRFTIPEPLMIGETGVVFELEGLAPSFEAGAPRPANAPPPWRGMFLERLAIRIPELFDGVIAASEFGIGNTGLYGSLSLSLPLTFDPEATPKFSGDVAGGFFGVEGGLKEVRLSLVQSIPSELAITGQLLLPFFERPAEVAAGVDATGKFTIALSNEDGLAALELDDLLRLQISSFGFELDDGVATFLLAGKMTPLVLGDQGMQWPSLDIEELSIDSDGNVDFDGGWLDFPQQQTLDFHGFQITLSELGFGAETATRADGTEANRQWLGVSGGIHLLEGVPMSASVEGLKISWDPQVDGGDVQVSLEGIALSLEIPNTLRLAGAVQLEDFDDGVYEGNVVRGQIELNILALRMVIGGELIIGHLTEKATGSEFGLAYVVLNAQFPTAIPLGATGAGLYGLLGLVGVNVTPDRRPSAETPEEPEAWYEWYKADRGGDSARNVTKMQKWGPKPDHYAFGAGLTVGTVYDDGFTVNVRALLAVLIPGPVILIEGRANLLKSRSEDSGAEGAFYALAVFDGIAGTFQLNIDVQVELEDVVTVGGGVEAFFDFNDASNWHLWLGQKEPESKRIRAQILSLFQVNLYLMIDNNGLLTGAKAALALREEYGPLELALEIGLSFDAGIYWNPPQCEGRLELLIELAIRIFGIGIQLLIQMLLEAKAATPFWVHGLARFAINLPFPLPSFDAQVEFTWEKPIPPEPVWPLLKAVELTHPLARDAAWTPTDRADSPLCPVVPVDALAVAKFARPLVGRSYRRQEAGSLEPLGHDPIDEFTLSYICQSIVLLERDETGDYRPVAKSPFSGPDEFDGLVPLDVSEESLLTGPDAQEPEWRLWKYEPLPGASVYEREDRAETLSPCPPPAALEPTCVEFSRLARGVPFGRRFRLGGWTFRSGGSQLRGGRLEFTDPLWVRFPVPMRQLSLRMSGTVALHAFYAGAEVASPPAPSDRGDSLYEVHFDPPEGVDTLRIEPRHGVTVRPATLERLCAVERDALAAAERLGDDAETAERLLDGGSARRFLLKPRSQYRLDVETRVLQAFQGGSPSQVQESTDSFYFRTGDGPGAEVLDQAAREELAERLPADDGSGLTVDQRIARLHFAAGPLNRLEPYLAGTFPAPEGDPFPHALDVRVLFRDRFVEDLYSDDFRLELRFRDLNGNPVPAQPVRLDPGSWDRTFLPLATPGRLTWEAQRQRQDCGTTGAGPVSGAPVLRTTLAEAGLRPRRRYLAQIVVAGPESSTPLHEFSFVTSAFASPTALLESGLVEPASADGESSSARLIVRRLEAPTVGLADSILRDARDRFVALTTARSELRTATERNRFLDLHDRKAEAEEAHAAYLSASAAAFDEVAAQLIRPTRQRPPRLEAVATRTADGLVLRLESPEPFAWTRWRIELVRRDGGSPGTLIPICSVDRTSALLVAATGSLPFRPGQMALTFEYSGLDALDQPELCIDGRPYAPEPIALPLLL